jgi:hypothetical protein
MFILNLRFTEKTKTKKKVEIKMSYKNEKIEKCKVKRLKIFSYKNKAQNKKPNM